jgi:hypothetical protein
MKPEQIAQLSDRELLDEISKIKPSPLFDAFFIGFMVGIILFGVVVNAWGFFMLVPLYLIYLFLKKSKNYRALQKEIQQRGLK